jgi:hypothetical protein
MPDIRLWTLKKIFEVHEESFFRREKKSKGKIDFQNDIFDTPKF